MNTALVGRSQVKFQMKGHLHQSYVHIRDARAI